jgi:hypothetical protein
MEDRIRISDADRERVTARLREHFAEGRLTSDELEERVTATLSAKTFGDLRHVMVDLPEPAPVPPQPGQVPQWGSRAVYGYRRGPRLLPLALIVFAAALILPGAGFAFAALFKALLLVWLVMCVAGVFAAFRFRRRVRRNWHSGQGNPWRDWESRH